MWAKYSMLVGGVEWKRMIKREHRCDLFFVGSIFGALFFSWLLVGVVLAVCLKGDPDLSAFRRSYLPFFAATAWALVVIGIRGMPKSAFFFQFLFISFLPLLIVLYKPSLNTLKFFNNSVLLLFCLDLIFNIFSLIYGSDLIGRSIDHRDGLVFGRFGGIFAHSFYSGSISLLAYIIYATYGKTIFFRIFFIFNLLLAGSWRFIAILPILFLLEFGWKKRKKIIEFFIILLAGVGILVGTVLTSNFSNFNLPENPSNTLRVYAWILAVEKIAASPVMGVGYPKDNELKAVDFETIDDSLTAESYYLGSALTYGVPYTLFFVSGFIFVFYGASYQYRKKLEAIFFPLILIDSIYGGFWGSILIYSWLWVIIVSFDLGRRSSRQRMDAKISKSF